MSKKSTEEHLSMHRSIMEKRLVPLLSEIRDRGDIFSKLVYLYVDGGNVVFVVNTGEIRAKVLVPLINQENILNVEYFFDFKSFFSLVKNSSDVFTIKERGRTPVINLYGGTVELENYVINKRAFEFSIDKTSTSTIPTSEFLKFVERAHKAMELAVRSEDRKIRVESKTGLCNFLSSSVIFNSLPINDISLRSADLNLILRAFKKEEIITISGSKSEIIFETDHTIIAIPKISTTDLSELLSRKKFSRLLTIDIDVEKFLRAVWVMKAIIPGTGRIRMEIDNKQVFWLRGNSSTKKLLEFPICSTTAEENIKFSCQVSTIRTMATLMRGEGEVKAYINRRKDMFVFHIDNMWVFLMHSF